VPIKDKTNRTQDKLVRLIHNETVQNLDAATILDKILKNLEVVRLEEIELAFNHNVPANNYLLKFY